MKFKYFGHSCFMLEYKGIKILLDPFIKNNPLSKIGILDVKPDIILLTHDHHDHLGDSIEISKHSGAQIITIFDLAQELNKFHVSTIGGNLGGTVEYKGIKFTFVKAEHSSSKGVAVGFIITTDESVVYFAGDTNVFMDMKIIKDIYTPSVVMLPIDGRFNMGLKEVCYALQLLEPKVVIPMHYGSFEVLKNTPLDLEKEISKQGLRYKLTIFNILEEKEI